MKTENMFYFNATPLNNNFSNFTTTFDYSIVSNEDNLINVQDWDITVQQAKKEISNFPKYPHIDCWLSDDGQRMFLQIALAGYSEKDIKANAVKNELFITAKRKKKERKYVHQGISKKEIDFSVKIDESYSLEKSKTVFKDSLLTFEIPRSPDSPIVSLL